MRMSAFLGEFGLTRIDVENWINRLTLRTAYAPTIPGRARQFSRVNALEIAIIGALIATGCKASSAPAFAEIIVDDYRNGTLKKWLIIPGGDPQNAYTTDQITTAQIIDLTEASPSRAAVLIDVKSIADKVDAISKENGDG